MVNYLAMKEEEREMSEENAVDDLIDETEESAPEAEVAPEAEAPTEPVPEPEVEAATDASVPEPSEAEVEVEKAGLSTEATQGILKQLQDSKSVLDNSTSLKVQKAVGKLTEAITWLEDEVRE